MTTRLEVFDPPMCCSSGVCGPKIDPALPRFAADLEWLRSQGVAVTRHNLAQEPLAFARNETVRGALLEDEGCLPLILVGGRIMSRRSYPGREDLALMFGLAAGAGGESSSAGAPAPGDRAGQRAQAEANNRPACSACSEPRTDGDRASGCCV